MCRFGKISLTGAAFLAIGWSQSRDSAVAELRLLTSVTSYDSAPGTEFRAVVIAPYRQNGRVLLPPGTAVYGSVRRAQAVGLGLIHERAGLELEFREYQLPDGGRFPLAGTLRAIDNARETVTERGWIKGILAAEGPQGLMRGIWHRPQSVLFKRSLIGMTGVTGHIWGRYARGPVSAVVLFAIRCSLFRLPEPEIQLPPGTELKLAVKSFAEDAPSLASAPEAEVPRDLAGWFQNQPVMVIRTKGDAADDIINVAFLGSREEMVQAFHAAGWSEAAPLTTRSISRFYTAFTTQAGYAAAPISRLLYGGDEPDYVFQKSLNTIAKRHHIRIWRTEYSGQEVWLGAATHDIGLGFNRGVKRFTHKIYAGIDSERTKVVNDLAFAGCSDGTGYVQRPAAVRGTGDQTTIATDGALAVIALRGCQVSSNGEEPPKSTGSIAAKMARRMILEAREYLLRDNTYYWAYRAVRWKLRDAKVPATFIE